MKLVVQRVSKASVKRREDDKVVGSIDSGLFVLFGVKKGDTTKNADFFVEKLSKLRVMADNEGKMNLASENFLIVSQFTLYADTSGGNRPSFVNAEDPEKAREIYEYFIEKLREKGVKVEIGSFGDYMEIETVLDGPVTIVLEN